MLRPLNDHVALSIIAPDSKTAGGLFIPETETPEKVTAKAVVMAVGPGKLLSNGSRGPMPVEPKQVVIFPLYCATEVTLAGEKLHVLSEADILGVVE